MFSIQKIRPVNLTGNQCWIPTGRTDAEAEAPILWPPDVKTRLIGKVPDAGKDLGQEDKGVTEDEMVGWHHWLNGHEFEQTPGESAGQGSLAWYTLHGVKKSRTILSYLTAIQKVRVKNNVPRILFPQVRTHWSLVFHTFLNFSL